MSNAALMEPISVGDWSFPNRVLMAPLTRSRASQPGDIPTELNATYYAQRAGAGLLIAEATSASAMGKGYAMIPGVWTDAQTAGWKLVTDAVHAKGGRIVLQLFHAGRISHTGLLPDGAQPVAPSAITAKSQTYIDDTGMKPVSEPRALATDEVPTVVAEFEKAAENAKAAGFDGVEIHGANGYLLDQFTRDGTNKRDDQYGGSVENRVRLPLEVAEAVAGVWGPGRVGYRISPTGTFNDISDADPAATFTALAKGLGALKLAYLHSVEAFAPGDARDEAMIDAVRETFKNAGGSAYISNGGLEPDGAAGRISAGKADAVAFGKLFIANPDLPARIAKGGPYNQWDDSTFYGGTEKGYTDYPTLAEA